jgi:hypothetical protein
MWAGERGVPFGIHRSKGGMPMSYRSLLTWSCPELFQSTIRFQYLPPAPIPPVGVTSVAPSLVQAPNSARSLVSVQAVDMIEHLNGLYLASPR